VPASTSMTSAPRAASNTAQNEASMTACTTRYVPREPRDS
jgi:hypothetical protein